MKTTAIRSNERAATRRAGTIGLMVIAVIASMFMLYGHFGATALAGSQASPKSAMTCPYIGDAAAIAEGKKLFDKNCSECHGDGTGGAGPDLTDDEWLCGGSDSQIKEAIMKGRPGGMPSWGTDFKDDEIWKIVAFIRSLKK